MKNLLKKKLVKVLSQRIIITIVVLLILAGVSISMITGENGIITQAKESKEKARGAEIKEFIELTSSENEMADYSNTAKKSKQDIIQKLLEDKKLTNQEVEELQNTDIITIGGIEIDFSIIQDENSNETDTNYIGKYVYHKNIKFIVSDQEEDKLTLTPLMFAEEYNYLLSGKYILQDGKKKSVNPDTEGALADETYEEFAERIKTELDDACQEIFGTADGRIKATNAEDDIGYDGNFYVVSDSEYEMMASQSPELIKMADSSGMILVTEQDNYETLLAKMEKVISTGKEVYEITDEEIAQIRKENTSPVAAAAFIMFTNESVVSMIMGDSTQDSYDLVGDLKKVNSGELSLDEIEDDNYRKLLTISDKLVQILVFDAIQSFWTTKTGYAGEGYWVYCLNGSDVVHDTVDWPTLKSGSNYFSKEMPLAPIITLNSELLKSIGGDKYKISI